MSTLSFLPTDPSPRPGFFDIISAPQVGRDSFVLASISASLFLSLRRRDLFFIVSLPSCFS